MRCSPLDVADDSSTGARWRGLRFDTSFGYCHAQQQHVCYRSFKMAANLYRVHSPLGAARWQQTLGKSGAHTTPKGDYPPRYSPFPLFWPFCIASTLVDIAATIARCHFVRSREHRLSTTFDTGPAPVSSHNSTDRMGVTERGVRRLAK
jgi:hypothetical protein